MVQIDPGTENVVATFRLPYLEGAREASVVGDFNGWSPTANPMIRGGEGFAAQVALEPGRAYRFRYLIDGERWENDWDADAYVPNEYGGNDSVVDLTGVALRRGRPAGQAPGSTPT